jgi:hypothetical protein
MAVAEDSCAARDGGLAGSAARPTGKEHGASLGMQCCGATHTSSYINTRKGFLRDFYFRALGSLVVLSFPQLLSFSSVFPRPLSETLRRSSDGWIPV